MKIGIVGLPYVGKTSLFNALTQSEAETGTYGRQKEMERRVGKSS